jgi:ABC-2 type transport system ATP-binding protein
MLEVKNLRKVFGDKVAVDDISLSIKKGEVIGLLGPNGAGKTTTMRLLTGFLVADSGDIELNGVSISEDPILFKSQIGYMPENNPLYKDQSVKESLEFILDLGHINGEERKSRLDYVVKVTDIADVFYKPISELSKGYKQRVGLAQVLIEKPKILILDEPTEGLDPNQREEIRKLIKELGKDRTVIISTHVMQEVEAMCDRIVIINKGKIVTDGDKNSILKGKEQLIVVNLKVESGKLISKDSFKELKSLETITINKVDNKIYEVMLSSKDINIFNKLNLMLKKTDWIVFELSQKKQSVEDIFKKLTK